jgi:hypothetical protein
MSTRIAGQRHLEQLRRLAAAPETQAALPPPPEAMIQWLAALKLFYGVPLQYLVPDERMLPSESLRFFLIDQNWLDALADGAVSPGLTTSLSATLQQAITPALRAASDAAITGVRAARRRRAARNAPARRSTSPGSAGEASIGSDDVELDGPPSGSSPDEPASPPQAGLLLRSAIVSTYPGLEVQAFADHAVTQPLGLLRMDQLSPSLLLCLFDGVPAVVHFNEPSEALHFGFDLDAGGAPMIAARSLSAQTSGQQLSPPVLVPPVFRDAGVSGATKRVLDVGATWTLVQKSLAGRTTLPPSPGAGSLAVQMVAAPEQVVFANTFAPVDE